MHDNETTLVVASKVSTAKTVIRPSRPPSNQQILTNLLKQIIGNSLEIISNNDIKK